MRLSKTKRADDLGPQAQPIEHFREPAPQHAPTPPGPQHAAPNFSIPLQAPQFYYESAVAPTPIARQAVLTDPDSPNFGGGWMTVTMAGATASDQLEITAFGGITVSGTTLLYNGVAIGTFSGGTNGTVLTVSFNSASTPAAAEMLARSFTYRSTSDNPPAGVASFAIRVNDGSGGEAQVTGICFVIAVNDAPVVTNLFGDLSPFPAGSAPIRIDAGTMVSLSDVDSSNFDGGALRLSITTGRVAGEDFLGLAAGSGVSLVSDALVVNGITIGAVVGGQNGGSNDFHFLLNSAATAGLVAQAINAVTYGNTNPAPLNGIRSIQVTFNDGDGTSNGGTNEITGVAQIEIGGGSEPPLLTLGSALTSDMAMSADGSLIYEARNDGFIRVYNAHTGALLQTWDVGTRLGALALSPDGSYLIAVEREEISEVQGVSSVIAAYRIDTATGAVTTYQTEVAGTDGAFWDMTILSGGRVLFTSAFTGQTRPHVLDLATGTFTVSPTGLSLGTTVTTSSDLSQVLIGSPASSGGAIALVGLDGQNHLTLLDQTDLHSAQPSTSGYNHGALAVSIEAGYVAQDAGLIHIWDLNLNYQFGLFLGQFVVAGLVFDPDGEFLFVLDSGTDEIKQVSLADRVVVRTISIGANAVFDWEIDQKYVTYANRILVTEDLGRFAVTTGHSIVRVENAMPSLDLAGTSGADNLTGSIGGDVLDGAGGADTMAGDHGDDIYHVDNAGDVIVEVARKGTDLVIASVSYTLTAGAVVERIEAVSGTAAIDLTGNAFAQTLVGNNGANLLDGRGGADIMRGYAGNDIYLVDAFGDQVIEAANEGSDTVYTTVSYQLGAGQSVEVLAAQDNSQTTALSLFGNELANVLFGNNGANFLDGAAGADIMTGFGGDDIYAIDNAGDLVDEAVGGGNDSIFTTFSYVLGLGASVETLAARDNSLTVTMNLFGNELNNVIFGNNGTNFIDGSTGADIMTGFGGDDTYAVDNAGDVVIEDAGRGDDAIFTTFSYVLGLGMSVETLASRDNSLTSAMNLFGNELDNFIFGNNGSNLIDGGAGADTMTGFGGDDSYIVDNVNDRVVENPGGGNDAIYTTFSYALAATHSIETLAAQDNSLTVALNLTGNELANTLLGNNGANILNGGGGADVLVGFGGADTFALTTAAAAGNADYIADFLAGTDKIALDDAMFSGVGTPGTFNAAAFVPGAAAADADDRIVYNAATGQLFYDADGNGVGAAVLIATLSGNPALTASDFQVI